MAVKRVGSICGEDLSHRLWHVLRSLPIGMTSFAELRESLSELYFQGRYREALELLEGYEPADQSEDEDILFWRMCLRSRLGDTDNALSVFSQALDRGHWWSERIAQGFGS